MSKPIPSSWTCAAIALVACSSGTEGADAAYPDPQEPREAGATSGAFDHEHTLWTDLLRARVRGDRLDYAAIKKDPSKLEAYLEQLHAVSPEQLSSWSREQRFAFWVNVYNAHTVKKVVDAYPLESIKDLNSGLLGVKSVFDDEFIAMVSHHPDGKRDELSLNDIEHEILRKRFKDARLHAAVNCASFSCPPLLNEAFVAERLEEQLDAQMRAFVADVKRNRFDRERNRLYLSEIFKWFSEDFERDAGSVRDYLLLFSPEKDAEFIRNAKIGYLDYDWSLNEVERTN